MAIPHGVRANSLKGPAFVAAISLHPPLRRLAAAISSTIVAVAALTAAALATTGVAHAQQGLPDTVGRLKPAIVAVGTFQKTRSPPFVFRGSGFAVGDGTLIATAAHVVAESMQVENQEVMMVLAQGASASQPQSREAKAIAVDKVHDIALLRITGAPLPTVTLGGSAAVREGQAVAFTGFPLGTSLGFHPVTHRAIVSAIVPAAIPSANAANLNARVIQSIKAGEFALFQLDASAYPGHSGSPLYDGTSGEVIGIVNMGLLKNTKDSAIGQPSGISLAVPVQHLKELISAAR